MQLCFFGNFVKQNMSSPELAADEYDYESYTNDWYYGGPPLISKRARLLVAATQNDVETLKELLDSPKWYQARDNYGYNLLMIAILRENDEVFDYLLSLDDFPLEATDNDGGTALVAALSYYYSNDLFMKSRYALELVKKGADIDKVSREGYPLLHCALDRGFVDVARSLLERGADVNVLNAEGGTSLDMSLNCEKNDLNEVVTMLLCYGADPSVVDNVGHTTLDYYLRRDTDIIAAQETLFYFTVDKWSKHVISVESLLTLAKYKSPLFHQVIKLSPDVIAVDVTTDNVYFYLFTICSEYLQILLEKCSDLIKEILQTHTSLTVDFFNFRNESINLNNLDILIQSSVSPEVTKFISRLDSSKLILSFPNLLNNERKFIETIYYLLSYGMTFNEIDLQAVYKLTGYSENFKNLLLMDVQKQIDEQITDFMSRLICDVTLDVHRIVENPSLCDFIDWEKLFDYFAHPKLQNAYYVIKNGEMIGRSLPQVPLLQELARDAFRKYFIKLFKITTAKQFYSLINLLPISFVHKKIITFESKLYIK